MSEIDQAFLETLLKFPESIISIGDWEIEICCAKCEKAIEKDTICLSNLSEVSDDYALLISEVEKEQWIGSRKCPNCNEPCPKAIVKEVKLEKGYKREFGGFNYDYEFRAYDVFSLPTKKIKTRKIITRRRSVEKTGWFSSRIIPEEFYTERQEISDEIT